MKKLFFLALMAFLWLPATTWANDVNEEFDDDDQEEYDENGDGKITSSSISLDYRILTVATGETQETAGTVELESVATSSAGATIGALSIPHIIVHVEMDESYNAYTYYYEVVGIAANAFRDDSTISSVTIPYTVTYIGNYAFDDCENLTMLAFAETGTTPSELSEIRTGAFMGAPIESLDLPASVESLGEKAFKDCSQITSLVLPANLTTISKNAFDNCGNLATVTLSGNTTLGSKAFGDCGKMTAVVLFNDEETESVSGGAEEEGVDPFGGDETDDIILYVPTGYAAVYAVSGWNTLVGDDDELSWNFFSTEVSANGLDSSDNTYYATYYVDEEGYILDGGTAYYVPSVTDGEINKQDITGIIPVNTAILIGSSAAGDYYFYKEYESTESEVTISNNMLYGSNEAVLTTGPDEDVEYYFYKLSRNAAGESGSAGFYWNDSEGGAFTCPAYKAYLAVPQNEAEGLNHISFKKDEGDTTGISAVESASEGATVKGIYNIQGVRVSNMNQPGLYIVDGKKVLVK